MQEMIVASRLADGIVVFLDVDSGWREEFRAGAVISDPQAKAAALETAARAVADNVVVDPYPIELEMRAGHLEPKSLRERVRAFGPSVRPDLGKQALGQAPTTGPRG